MMVLLASEMMERGPVTEELWRINTRTAALNAILYACMHRRDKRSVRRSQLRGSVFDPRKPCR